MSVSTDRKQTTARGSLIVLLPQPGLILRKEEQMTTGNRRDFRSETVYIMKCWHPSLPVKKDGRTTEQTKWEEFGKLWPIGLLIVAGAIILSAPLFWG
jgi:hypothetical protein